MTKPVEVKTAPNSKETEMMVLGCMLSSVDNLQSGSEILVESDFYYDEHKIIFNSLKTVYKRGKPADIHLTCEELKSQDKLSHIGGVSYMTTLAQYAGTSAYIEEYIALLKNKSLLRELILHSREIEKSALDSPENAITLINRYQDSLKKIETRYGNTLPVIEVEARLKQLETMRKKYNGRKYLGLCVRTIEEFNEKLLGLRRLNLLAAAPNVGKTALTIQLSLETLLEDQDVCLAYFSLEMTSLEIFTRMNLFLSQMNFHSFVFGSQGQSRNDVYYTQAEYEKISSATETFRKIGNRLQIIDSTMSPVIDARSVITYVEALKEKTKCSRAIVVIDYLQVWPMNPNMRFPSENEVDKWRMGEMKKIRDVMNEDPVIVISEARKPSGSNEIWGGDLSDVMGSARGTYTPDVVMLLSQLKPKSLAKLWEKNNMPKDFPKDDSVECSEDEKPGLAIKNFLASHGIAICKLDVPKARDGMHKFNILLEFYFQKNTFRKINWEQLRDVVKKETSKKQVGPNF